MRNICASPLFSYFCLVTFKKSVISLTVSGFFLALSQFSVLFNLKMLQSYFNPTLFSLSFYLGLYFEIQHYVILGLREPRAFSNLRTGNLFRDEFLCFSLSLSKLFLSFLPFETLCCG